MKNKHNALKLSAFALLIALFFSSKVYALDSVYSEINLSQVSAPTPIELQIDREQSDAYGWNSGQTLEIKAFIQKSTGELVALKDRDAQDKWLVVLNEKKEAALQIYPSKHSYSGRLLIKANDRTLYATTPYLSESTGKILEKIYEYEFPDGAKIKVHYTDQLLEEVGASVYFPKEVLDAAVYAYQIITQFEGFASKGFAFANPDKNYAYDPDSTIDIYIGNPSAQNPYTTHGFSSTSFRDAPCFDTLKLNGNKFEAVILLPANYEHFIKNWEKLNPSPLGTRDVRVDLKGTLIHEMLHVIIFYYNKNLNKEAAPESEAHKTSAGRQVDWYVEGLARYFETFAGARHDFFSQGFKQILPDKIRFSRGGSNYFMRYPDQPFIHLRYENALFWRFLDGTYGMKTIEALSQSFRNESDFRSALEKATGTPFEALLKNFSKKILYKDFGLKEDSVYLKDVAKTKLLYRGGELYLPLRGEEAMRLGKTCRTDWISEWGESAAKPGENPIAGDNTEVSDVSGWATDFVEVQFESTADTPVKLFVQQNSGREALLIQVFLETKGGSVLSQDFSTERYNKKTLMDLSDWLAKENLNTEDILKLSILITNTSPSEIAEYSILAD